MHGERKKWGADAGGGGRSCQIRSVGAVVVCAQQDTGTQTSGIWATHNPGHLVCREGN